MKIEKKSKKLCDFTIFEFNKYLELTSEDDNQDVFAICELFGFDVDEMDVADFQQAMNYVNSQTSLRNPRKGVKKTYDINGIRYKASLNLKKIKASQFIDLQMYTPDNKLEEILSVILIPMEKKYFGLKYVEREYAKDYDIEDVQKEILYNFKIGDANELSAFFTTIHQLIESYEGLFGKEEDVEGEDEDDKKGKKKSKQQIALIWMESMDIVSEVVRIPLYDTGDLNIYSFLNALNYNKYKTKKVNSKYGK